MSPVFTCIGIIVRNGGCVEVFQVNDIDLSDFAGHELIEGIRMLYGVRIRGVLLDDDSIDLTSLDVGPAPAVFPRPYVSCNVDGADGEEADWNGEAGVAGRPVAGWAAEGGVLTVWVPLADKAVVDELCALNVRTDIYSDASLKTMPAG